VPKVLSVTLTVSDGDRECTKQILVPDNLLSLHTPHNDHRQDRVVFDLACAFTDVYTRFVTGGE
jgi:hypothetical protein